MTSRRPPRRCWRSSVVVLLTLCAAGCVERALDATNAVDAAAPDLARQLDLGSEIDLASHDLAGCSVHSYVPIGLSSLSTLGETYTFFPTAAVRALLTFPVRTGCDIPADIDLVITPGTTTIIEVHAHLWRGEVGCGPIQQVVRDITVPASQIGSPSTIIVRDGETTIPIAIAMHAVSMTSSCASSQLGDLCYNDCDCTSAADALCLFDGSLHHCALFCHDDAQCRNDAMTLCLTSTTFECLPSQVCRTAADCAFGESVENCACTPSHSSPGGLCACDADCASGALCDGGACVRPCSGPHTCADYGDGEGGSLCMAGRCVQLI
jgi:hypothetical protein